MRGIKCVLPFLAHSIFIFQVLGFLHFRMTLFSDVVGVFMSLRCTKHERLGVIL